MRVVFAPRALRDLQSIGDHIGNENPRQASRFVTELRDACSSLAEASDRYPMMEGFAGTRRMPFGNYLIFYQVEADQVRILRVVHAARDWTDLLD
jgi:toxin ParE1/3/4